ncbi:hypothetical protein SCUCBS95973_009776 [Sporothrix curviconia]|uniref:Uncharacterized protein n=1 Tax=Sporothrix curviconia TaxID=1260050 RepID=A0ABP0CXQ8_9PEZI
MPTNVPLPISLPYFCNPTELPDTQPSVDEIERATVFLPTIRDARRDRIVLVRDCFVVKYGRGVTENEGQALLFLAHHSFIHAPRLFQ